MPTENDKKTITAYVITAVALGMCAFHLYTAQFGLFSAMVQRPVHLLFACTLVLLIFPIRRLWSEANYPVALRVFDWVLIAAVAVALYHIASGYRELVARGGAATETDLWLGGLILIMVLETTRRVMGSALPIITMVALAYTLWGHHIPGLWGHRVIDLEQLISYQYLTTEGLFTIPLGVSASFIFIFILFGAFLVASGTGEFFIKFANALAGHLRGGPAKVAVLSSATFGSISGSAVANVVSTGSFTIPLDEEDRLPPGVRRGHRIGGFNRRSVHAPGDGRGGLYHRRHAWALPIWKYARRP
jgi:TRAP-type uncharacterized transport system fused permease subunit